MSNIKLIALILMTIDHIGYYLYPDIEIFRIVGRGAFPLFVYSLINTFRYTKHLNQKIMLLFTYGIIAQLIFNHINAMNHLNVFFTLGLALLSLKNKYYIIPCMILSEILNVDYGMYGIIIVHILNLRNKFKRNILFIIASIIFGNIYSVYSLIIIDLINNKKYTKKYKWIFPVYYVLHIVLLKNLCN